MKRALSTPGVQKPVSLCEIKNTGTNKDGHTIQIAKCDDGYTGPLSDQWVDTFRIDVIRNFTHNKMGADGMPEAVATVGMIGSFNISHRTATSAIYSVAFGPTLHPKGVPHKALLAVVFGVTDITDAADKGKTFRDKFGVKLYFGVPLTGF